MSRTSTFLLDELDQVLAINHEKIATSQLIKLIQSIIDKALDNEKVHFTSFFSKLAYLIDKFKLDTRLSFELHYLRRAIEQDPEKINIQSISYVSYHLIKQIWKIQPDEELKSKVPNESGIPFSNPEKIDYLPFSRFICFEVFKKEQFLTGYLEDEPSKLYRVHYNISDRNERFTTNLESLHEEQFPILIQLLEIEVRDDNGLYPTAFVIEPDYVVDVTSIANAFDFNGTQTVSYKLKKFFPAQFSKSLLIGNIANFCLDELVNDPSIEFNSILSKIFSLDPLGWAQLDDNETRDTLKSVKKHFKNIQSVIVNDFKKEGIERNHCYLEPSFYSSKYGLQGRLDLLQIKNDEYSIVELKSGSTFKPNVYGLNNNHYTQTLLYDLLIRSAFSFSRPKNYILYSKNDDQTLRIAPRIAAQQKEALKVRNELLQFEHTLQSELKSNAEIATLNAHNYPGMKGFTGKDLLLFGKVYQALDEYEKIYFRRMSAFVALEHRLAKIGEYGQDVRNGLASLWLDSFEEKMERFEMISFLQIEQNESMESEPTIQLYVSEFSNTLSNFRIGDIAVLYPQNKHQSCLNNQVFKCTILHLDKNCIKVRLRSQQRNQEIFETNTYWALEHDMMDSNFNKMYQQLFSWAKAPKSYRDLLLAYRPPTQTNELSEIYSQSSLTMEQNILLQKMIDAKEYFLVWGPPGTGKTSRIIKHYVEYVIDKTENPIYILAYTNRAVDEICEAIHNLGDDYKNQYFRIGSKYSTDEEYQSNLLNEKLKSTSNRKDIIKMIKSHRIIVGTLSSILGKPLILELIPPHEVIIDEASQILEPNIVGILQRFSKFILVGDHRQLPAVVVQSKIESEVNDPKLRNQGLVNCRNSLFERLYIKAKNMNWHWAFGLLSQQGRMHKRLMDFSNEHFYNNQLKIIPNVPRLEVDSQESNHFLDNRLVFIHANTKIEERYSKTNSNEVEKLVEALQHILKRDGSLKNVGVITPFRAQIAAINKRIEEEKLHLHGLKIDTVERFQGSAKDIIMISFCANNPFQLEQMSSLSVEGIDRKLNVALTRAKEQIILTGNQYILRKNPLYADLLDKCVKTRNQD